MTGGGGIWQQYHEGGVVGSTINPVTEEFAKLLKGEVVGTPKQVENFMTKTLPSMAGIPKTESNALTSLNLEKIMDINVAGNLDKSVIPDLDRIANSVMDKLVSSLSSRGLRRNASVFSI
jgi:hypothetical protein